MLDEQRSSDMQMNEPPPIPPLLNPEYTIQFELTRWDMFLNYLTIFARNRFLQVFVPVCLVICVGLRLTPHLGREPVWWLALYATGYCFAMLAVVMASLTLMGLVTSFTGQHRGVLGKHTLEITQEGLRERTDVNEALHRWPGITRVLSVGGYLFIYLGESTAHFQVPKRGFSPEIFKKFEAELRTRANL